MSRATNGAETCALRIQRLPHGRDLELPRPATADAAGIDLRACVEGTVTVEPGTTLFVPTGIAIQLPPGFEGQVRPRSGLAKRHGVTLLNSPGTIDADYRGEIGVLLVHHGQHPLTIERGQRIAQLVIQRIPRIVVSEVEALEPTPRGGGGFGHTGER